MGKKRGSEIFKRKKNTREIYQRFLIVCEGTKTEPNYFKAFPINTESVIVTVEGTGGNTASLVKAALVRKRDDDYDQVWCVFDRDSFSAGQVNEAFELAGKKRIKTAFSNEAFELWYLLHFDYLDAAHSRHDYCEMLSERLGFKYEKNNPGMYEELKERLDTAVRNATNLMECYPQYRPAHDNPSTTVHLLVQELRKYTLP